MRRPRRVAQAGRLLTLAMMAGVPALGGCGSDDATTPARSAAAAASVTVSDGPAALGPVPASILTFNLCGSVTSDYCREPHLPALADFIASHRPTAFALQEVCGYQANELSRMLRNRGLEYVQRYRNLSVNGVAPFCGSSLGDRIKGEGIALFHAGTTLGEIREGNFETLSCADYLPEFPGCALQPRGYVCAKVPQAQLWACATHIEVKEHVQKAQIDELARVAQELNASTNDDKRIPVVVAGDFNVEPAENRISAMFDQASYTRGSGSFFEPDVRSDRTFAAAAATQGNRKIDYVFHSANVSVVTSAVFQGVNSDHRMLFNELLLPAERGD